MVFIGIEIENKSKSFITLLGKLEQIQRHCDNMIMYMLSLREKMPKRIFIYMNGLWQDW